MTVREYLRRPDKLRREILRRKARAAALRDLAASFSLALEQVSVRSTPDVTRMQELLADAADEDEEGVCERCACLDRARLMGALSELMLDMGARFDDGIRLEGKGYRLHISPSAQSSAVRIAVQSEDAEFARALCLSARELAEALQM